MATTLAPVLDVVKQYVDLHLLSQAVSYLVIVGAAVVKLPQIFNVLRAGTARGLSLPSLYLETVATMAGTIYNVLVGNPFRTFGETALIFFQNLVIVALVWRSASPRPSGSYMMGVVSVAVGLGAALWQVPALTPVWPPQLTALGVAPLDMIQNFVTLLYILARVPQIVQNFRQGHTGVLSVVTLIMNVGGNVARLGTSLKEGLAPVVIYSFVLNGALNLLLLLQVVAYWSTTATVLKKSAAAGAAAKGKQAGTPSKAPATPTPASVAKKSPGSGKDKKPKAE